MGLVNSYTTGYLNDTVSESESEWNDGVEAATNALSKQYDTSAPIVNKMPSTQWDRVDPVDVNATLVSWNYEPVSMENVVTATLVNPEKGLPNKSYYKKKCRVKDGAEQAYNGVCLDPRYGGWTASVQIAPYKRLVLGKFKDAEAAADKLETFLLDRLEKTVVALEKSMKENTATLTAKRINDEAAAKEAVCESKNRLNAGKRKRYTCETCQKACLSPSNLKVHLLSHTTSKTYHCICGKQFRYKSSLDKHTKACAKCV
jgi:hypothetical protein